MSLLTIIQSYPRISIIIIALLVSFFISLVNYIVMDKEKMRDLKARQKKLNEEMKLHKGDTQKMMELQKQMLSHAGENFKSSLKPMLITTIPILVVFSMVRGAFAQTVIVSTWYWYYLVTAIAGSLVFRKVFKLP